MVFLSIDLLEYWFFLVFFSFFGVIVHMLCRWRATGRSTYGHSLIIFNAGLSVMKEIYIHHIYITLKSKSHMSTWNINHCIYVDISIWLVRYTRCNKIYRQLCSMYDKHNAFAPRPNVTHLTSCYFHQNMIIILPNFYFHMIYQFKSGLLTPSIDSGCVRKTGG